MTATGGAQKGAPHQEWRVAPGRLANRPSRRGRNRPTRALLNSAQPSGGEGSRALACDLPATACAVCRAAGWGDWSRCAVRMTAKGSVTPWMACGSRPVKGSPERGAFPTVGIHQWPGVKGAGPFAPLPPPPTAGWQIATADGAEPDQADSEIPNPDSTLKATASHIASVGFRPTQPQPNRRPIATAQGPAPSIGQGVGPSADREANRPPLAPPFQPLIVTGDRSPSGDLAFATG